MATITLNITSNTINTITPVSPAFEANIGQTITAALTTLDSFQNAASSDFSNFLLYGNGSYGFASATEAIVRTSFATYAVYGPNLQAQTQAALASGHGGVNVTQFTANFNSANNYDVLNALGSIVINLNGGTISSTGQETSESITINTPSSTLFGTQETITASGNIGFSNGYVTSGSITSGNITSNGFISSEPMTGNISITPYGSTYTLSGTVAGFSEIYSNGDYVKVSDLNADINSNFAFNALPSGGNRVSGTYAGGLAFVGGTGDDIIAAGNGPTMITGGGGVDTVTFRSIPSEYSIALGVSGSYIISSAVTGEGPDTLSGITYASFSDGSKLDLTTATWNNGTSLYTTTNVADAAGQAASQLLNIVDTATDVQNGLDSLQALSANGKIGSIALTNSGTAVLSITAAQSANDHTALLKISGSYDVSIDASAADATATGVVGHATTAVFSGSANQYSITPSGDGASFTVTDIGTGRVSIDHLSNINALQFSDYTVIVASQMPPVTGAVSSAQVTELYGAVFGRTPDVAGLAFYQTYAAAHPGTPFTQFAQWFLSSPEYINNAAHNYAQSAAGDSQFITDSYDNLLHRGPAAGDATWYESNVISHFIAGLTPGTPAYAQAELQAHAQVLAYFSQSPEFLGDVHITAQHPADPTHWLVLI